ncbi:hypothetical protein ACFY5C_33205 [Streptomyces sp. NPDC012935]|uniref:hypothetical protein n=1 Tax=Streptomyces sp. NPDC012935 TaxID=3364857 RepID=UPI0036CB482D
MAHLEPARLVELALGSASLSGDTDAQRHVSTCCHCREQLQRMTRVVVLARSVDTADLPVAPLGRVWQRIAQQLSQTTESTQQPPGE